jgi:hypothetical protein
MDKQASEKKPRIFLSHSNEDFELSAAIKDFLTHLGLSVFHCQYAGADPDKANIPGEQPSVSMLSSVGKADLIICLLTPAYAESHWCQSEAGIAALKTLANNGRSFSDVWRPRADGDSNCWLLPLLIKPFSRRMGPHFSNVLADRTFVSLKNAETLLRDMQLPFERKVGDATFDNAETRLNEAIDRSASAYSIYADAMPRRQSAYNLSSLSVEYRVVGDEAARVIERYHDIYISFVGASLKYSHDIIKDCVQPAIASLKASIAKEGTDDTQAHSIRIECHYLERTEYLSQLGAMRDVEEVKEGRIRRLLEEIAMGVQGSIPKWEPVSNHSVERITASDGKLTIEMNVIPLHVLPSLPGILIAGSEKKQSVTSLFAGECVMKPSGKFFSLIVGENPYAIHRTTTDWKHLSRQGYSPSSYDENRICQFLYGVAYFKSHGAHPSISSVLRRQDIYNILGRDAATYDRQKHSRAQDIVGRSPQPSLRMMFVGTTLLRGLHSVMAYAMRQSGVVDVFICDSNNPVLPNRIKKYNSHIDDVFDATAAGIGSEELTNVESRIVVHFHGSFPTMRAVCVKDRLCGIFPYAAMVDTERNILVDSTSDIGFLVRQGDQEYHRLESMVEKYCSVLKESSKKLLVVTIKGGNISTSWEGVSGSISPKFDG